MSLSKYAGMAGMWSMDLTSPTPDAESSFGLETTEESIFDPDHRSLADENDYKDGGKYRAIVKLQMRYEKQHPDDPAYAMGTGWLISPDMLVTAGHNVYSWAGSEEGLGRAVHINCYIGYHGRDSINSPIVQRRLAKTVVTTAEWLTSKDNRHRDVAFIQLDRPFEGNLRVFSYKPTPKAGDEMIGVVGYPADKSITDKEGREEKGALMYEMFNDIQYNLEDKKNNSLQMLKYRISTFGGQSGAPVIRKNAKQVAIATHVYGGGDKNQASVIGKYGNDYDTLISVFSQRYQVAGNHEGINLLKVPSATSNGAPQIAPIQPTLKSPEFNSNGFHPVDKPFNAEEAEGFFEVLRSVGSVVGTFGQKALPFVSPLLGPLGGPVSAIAGAALGAMANACAESAMDGIVSPLTSPELVAKGTTERAILAEASLQAVLKMDQSPVTNKILGHMQNTYCNLAPNVKYIAPKLAPGLLSSAYKIAVDKNYVQKNEIQRRTLPARPLRGDWAESSFGSNDFVNGMMQPTRPLEGEEAFFDDFGRVMSSAFQFGKPLLQKGAKFGLNLLSKALAESSFDAESSLDNHDAQAAELVAKRAIMGEAALQALMTLNKSELGSLQLVNDSGDIHEEGFFDFIKTSAQKIGAVVKDTAATVIKAVVPIVVDALGKPTSQKERLKPSAAKSNPSLRTKKSILNMAYDGTLKVSALGPHEVVSSLVRVEQQRTEDSILPSLRRVDSNKDLPVFQEL
ncbi:trypsin-like serine protease [Xylariaceae sp. AK1471]|nr:trypsin-like serine protease [Xylariaceae sp. AK1471]